MEGGRRGDELRLIAGNGPAIINSASETWVAGLTSDSFLLVGSYPGTRNLFFGEIIADKTDGAEMFCICKTVKIAEK